MKLIDLIMAGKGVPIFIKIDYSKSDYQEEFKSVIQEGEVYESLYVFHKLLNFGSKILNGPECFIKDILFDNTSKDCYYSIVFYIQFGGSETEERILPEESILEFIKDAKKANSDNALIINKLTRIINILSDIDHDNDSYSIYKHLIIMIDSCLSYLRTKKDIDFAKFEKDPVLRYYINSAIRFYEEHNRILSPFNLLILLNGAADTAVSINNFQDIKLSKSDIISFNINQTNRKLGKKLLINKRVSSINYKSSKIHIYCDDNNTQSSYSLINHEGIMAYVTKDGYDHRIIAAFLPEHDNLLRYYKEHGAKLEFAKCGKCNFIYDKYDGKIYALWVEIGDQAVYIYKNLEE